MAWHKPTDSDNHTVQLSDGGDLSTVLEMLMLLEEDSTDVHMDNIITNDDQLQKGKSEFSSSSPMEPMSVESECCSSNGGKLLAIIAHNFCNGNKSLLLPLTDGTEAMIMPTMNQHHLSPT